MEGGDSRCSERCFLLCPRSEGPFFSFKSGMQTRPAGGGGSWFKTMTRLKCRLHSAMLCAHTACRLTLQPRRLCGLRVRRSEQSFSAALNRTAVRSSAVSQTNTEHGRATGQKHATTRHCMPQHLPGTSSDQLASNNNNQ